MIRVTKITDYGVALMTRFARGNVSEQSTAPELAKAMHLPLPTVRKILKILTTENLLVSVRGAAGGYSLARDPEEISLMELVAALEGPVALTECASGDPCDCALEKVCGLKENWSLINQLMRNTLERYNLAQMADSLETVDGN
jgi:FeS assembly SUF system regulator